MTKLNTTLEQIERAVVAIAGRAGPLLAPVPTAYLVYAASLEYLAWPQAVAAVAALIIECLGLAATSLVLELHDYNNRKLKSEPGAPVKLALVLVSLYFFVATGLTVALDIVPELARYAPAIFPTLSLAGVSILAIRSDHSKRLAENEQARIERAEKRTPKRTPKKSAQVAQKDSVQLGSQNAQAGAQDATLAHINATRQERKAQQMDALVDALGQNPTAGATELGALLSIHRNTVYNYLTELADAGRVTKNGNGYKVVA